MSVAAEKRQQIGWSKISEEDRALITAALQRRMERQAAQQDGGTQDLMLTGQQVKDADKAAQAEYRNDFKTTEERAALQRLVDATPNAPGGWVGIRDTIETSAVLIGNYYVPGSATLTSKLTSAGSQDNLNSMGGRMANLAIGVAGASADAVTPAQTAPKPDLSFSDALSKAASDAISPKNLVNVGKNAAMNAATQYAVNGEVDWRKVGAGAVGGMIGQVAGNTASGMNVFGDTMLGNAGEAAIGGAASGATRAAINGTDISDGLITGGLTAGAGSLINQGLGQGANKTLEGGYLTGAAGGAINALVNGGSILDKANNGGFGGAVSGALQEYGGVDTSFANVIGNLATKYAGETMADDVTSTPGGSTTPTVTGATGNDTITGGTGNDTSNDFTSFSTLFVNYKDLTKAKRTWERG